MEFKDQRRMLEKMRRFDRAISKNGGVGTTPRGLLINYSNQCNFKCNSVLRNLLQDLFQVPWIWTI